MVYAAGTATDAPSKRYAKRDGIWITRGVVAFEMTGAPGLFSGVLMDGDSWAPSEQIQAGHWLATVLTLIADVCHPDQEYENEGDADEEKKHEQEKAQAQGPSGGMGLGPVGLNLFGTASTAEGTFP